VGAEGNIHNVFNELDADAENKVEIDFGIGSIGFQ
jgi:hypothetical protein